MFLKNSDLLCVIIFINTIPCNPKKNIWYQYGGKIKNGRQKQDGGQILSCIVTALNLYRLLHYKQSSKIV